MAMVSTQLKVKELLKERNWTTKILSEKTGMSESYLTHIKNATRRWNEDALKKIADAFSIEPVELLANYSNATKIQPSILQEELLTSDKKFVVKKVPVVGEIPSYPSEYNNRSVQVTTGFKDVFIPLLDSGDDSIFCLVVENQTMAPRFVKGDYLVVSPLAKVETGDLAAVEYNLEGKMQKRIAIVNFSDDLVLLESVNYKSPTVALRRSKDQLRIIGKLICTYQKYP